jgi:glycosyltransferase involved in cell wall biosynthesis
MTSIVLATLAAATPMGQQEYEVQLAEHLPGAGVETRSVRIRSMRSTLPGDARLPLRALAAAPLTVQHAAARIAYGRSDLVHRADLRLPAAHHEVVTVHDLAPLRFDDEGEIPPKALDNLRRARAVICPSEFAAGEVRELVGLEDPVVIHNGLDPHVWHEVDPALVADRKLPETFVLHSGGATKRKNLAALAGAWTLLADGYSDVGLVLCGPPDPRRSALFDALPRVHLVGRVERDVHLALMSAAAVVVVPSTYEGFGFPALEAMARGSAVVAANRASLGEICGEAAVLVEPSAEGLADAVGALLRDEAKRAAVAAAGRGRALGFTWERAAAEHAVVYSASTGRLPA